MRQLGRLAVLFGSSFSLICWECDNAKSMEDCKAQKRARECNDNERTCQQEIRSWGAGGMYKSITQRCKQKHACVNNHVQNPRAAWLETQCQPFTHPENSVCRCCCHWNYCNGKEYAGCYGLKAAKEEFEKTSAAPETVGSTVAPSVASPTEPYRTVTLSSTNGATDGPPNAEGPTVPGVTEEPVTIDMLTMSPPPPACQWSQWTEWDKCSETCGGGQRNRYRNPVGGTVGSAGCEGYAEGVEYCATQDCEAKECNDNYVDVCFLIPVTNATSARDLRMMKSFIRSCQGHIGDFGAEDLQFCVYQYNSEVQKVVSLEDSAGMTNKEFKDALDNMVPLNGTGADLTKAFDAIHNDGFDDSAGWRRNDQIPSVLVVLTDLINDGSHYSSLVNVHNKAYRVVGIGIGDGANVSFMDSIVSQPANENTFVINSYAKLDDIVDEVGYDICQVDYWRDDQCLYQNGGCAADETCFIQYNGRQCYSPSY